MSDIEDRLEELEDKVAALEGAEPTTRGPAGKPVTLAQAHLEIDLLWKSIRAIREEIAEIRSIIAP